MPHDLGRRAPRPRRGAVPAAQHPGPRVPVVADHSGGRVPGRAFGGTGAPAQRHRAAGPDDPGARARFLDPKALEARAREVLPAPVFDYYAGGAEAEITLAEAT